MSKGYRTVTIRLTPETERQIESLIAASQRSARRPPKTVSDVLREGVQRLWTDRQRSQRYAASRRGPTTIEASPVPGATAVAERLNEVAERLLGS